MVGVFAKNTSLETKFPSPFGLGKFFILTGIFCKYPPNRIYLYKNSCMYLINPYFIFQWLPSGIVRRAPTIVVHRFIYANISNDFFLSKTKIVKNVNIIFQIVKKISPFNKKKKKISFCVNICKNTYRHNFTTTCSPHIQLIVHILI